MAVAVALVAVAVAVAVAPVFASVAGRAPVLEAMMVV